MKRLYTILMICVAALQIVSCDKDPIFDNGDYQYENRDLTFLENFDGILIHWSEQASDEQKEVVRELAASMVRVKGGTFNMGATGGMAAVNECPIHQVTLPDYRMAKFVITQKQWEIIMGYDLNWDSRFGVGDDFPATGLTYSAANEFIAKINQLSELNFRLPTEAEWEFAARGGNNSQGYLYSGSNKPEEVAWCQENAENVLHPVGVLQPNELGLFDMSGNIYEWCADYYGAYLSGTQNNPSGPETGTERVLRGGSISYESPYSRVTARQHLIPETTSFVVGMRLSMSN